MLDADQPGHGATRDRYIQCVTIALLIDRSVSWLTGPQGPPMFANGEQHLAPVPRVRQPLRSPEE